MNRKYLWLSFIVLLFAGISCGDDAFLGDAISESYAGPGLPSGDILVISGGNTSHLNNPYPLHQILHYSSEGKYQGTIYKSADPTRTLLYGADHPRS